MTSHHHHGGFSVTAGATRYVPFGSAQRGASATEADFAVAWNEAGTVDRLLVTLATAPGSGQSVTVTLRVNGADTALSVTLAGTDTAELNLTDSVAVADGDVLSVKCVTSASYAGASLRAATRFRSAAARRTCWPSTCNGSQGTSAGTFSYAGLTNGVDASEANRRTLNAVAGTVKKLTARLTADPGGAASRTFTLFKNGVATALAVTVSAGSTVATASVDVAAAPGDYFSIKRADSGSPAASHVALTASFEADEEGEYNIFGAGASGLSSSGVRYVQPPSDDATSQWASSESGKWCNPFGATAAGLRVLLGSAPGAGKSIAFKSRRDGASDGTITVLVADSATAGSFDAGSDAFTEATDSLGLSATPAGTPSLPSTLSWAFRMRADAEYAAADPSGPRKAVGVKVYTQAGEFLASLPVAAPISFEKRLDGGLGELNLRVEGRFDATGQELALGNVVRVTVTTDGAEKVVYGGYVSRVLRELGDREGVTLTCLGWHTLMAMFMYRSGTTVTITHTAAALGAVVKAIVDLMAADSGSLVRASGSGISATAGPTVTYKFENRTVREAVDDAMQMATGGEHWYVDADGAFWWAVPSAAPDHKLTFGLHFNEISTETSLEKLRNTVYVWNGATGGVFKRYQDADSVARYGQRSIMLTDAGATAAATAMDQIGARSLADMARPPVTMRLRVEASPTADGLAGYDIESIEPGQTVRLLNVEQPGAEWLRDSMLVTAVQYALDHAVLTVDVVPAGIDRFQRAAKREIDKLSGKGAPTAYTT